MKKVIIIGAGPAGITAGYELLKQSDEYEVTILEESPYIGGISRTEVYNGHRMDIGGHRFFSKSEEVNDWWEQIMPMQGAPAYDDDKLGRDVPLAKDGPNPEKVDRVMLNRSRISHIYYNRKFFEYPVKMNMDTFKNMGFGTTMQAGFSYLGSMVAKKPENSLENFYINQFGKKLYSMFFEGYTEKLWGRHPREIDPSWGAQRTKGLSITEIVKDATRKVFHKEAKEVNTSLIGAFKYPKLGPGQLWEAAAADFEAMGGSIHLNCRVIRINTEGNKVESVTCAVDGITIEEKADIVISSMPIKDLIIGMSCAPQNVTEVARKLPYRDFVTVGLLVPKLRINNTTYMKTLGNVIPDTWIYVQDTGIKMGRIQIFNNWSPYLVENPEKTVWVGLEYFCNEGDRYWNMTDEEWIEFATKELIHMGILSESAKVLDAHKVAVKKAYPAYFDTYARFDEVRTFLDGFENLYCVGRNGHHRYNNMDHSMITSFEAVKNILSGQKDKSNIWNVNTEQEYHEEKNAKADTQTEEKKTVTAAPVPPVKEVAKPETTPVQEEKKAPASAKVPEKKEEPVKEEEIKATVQAVPTPPVRKQIRRMPKPVEPVVEETVTEAPTAEPVVETSPVAVEAPVVEMVAPVLEEVVPEAEIHVSKSRSIWDDVAMAEAAAPVKTEPIKVKPAVEVVPVAPMVETAPVASAVEETKPEEKSEPVVVVEVKVEAEPEVKAETVESVQGTEPVTVTQQKSEEPKKTARKKRTKKAVEVTEEKTAEETMTEIVAEETPVVAEETPKKATRSRRKPKKEEEAAVIEPTEESKAEEVVEPAEEAKAEDSVEIAETNKAEEVVAVVEEPKTEEPVEVVEEVKAEEPVEVAEEVKAEDSVEVIEEAKAEDSVEITEEVKEADTTKDTKKKPRKSNGTRRKSKESVAEHQEEKQTKASGSKSTEEPIQAELPKAESVIPSRSAAGKTISGRSASHRSVNNRKAASRRKVEPEKKATNVGKEAVIGSMKGTVIKENVIPKETTKK